MEAWIQRIFLTLALSPLAVIAQTAQQPLIEPDIERKVVSEDLLDSENWLLGIRGGVLSIEDFGSSALAAVQLSYQINESFYLSAEYAMAKAGLTSFEELSGAAPLLTDSEREWRYYGAHLGYNVLPGEVFFGRDYAMNSALSLFAGAGNVDFAGDKVFALQLGSQFRLYATDWLTLELSVSDYIFETTILARTKTTHNLALGLGVAVYF
ncbi:MAG: outer membrane beta-barrel domain-containing protein [Gammaproteobacteria bacterium]|nr:outer membrane beta-barrel domain-containing protein [Gammaproteobacteria bacterium]MBU1554392.1 outer membrane beta-barrel domain-containing protein [Gammaproteobacteria bacterium]MBU2071915.1 outer membrane beta-barrel domain-containing protein [Gammaproteobacteria bacterium]MBU2181776.1 outer membrane beta-barrel domain-containing protein [Gammaproteobacteria bacterium]MBU2206364.1 outer membrane beta-barrel domain-containing protein [Gammaproteobacteria bacterium]